MQSISIILYILDNYYNTLHEIPTSGYPYGDIYYPTCKGSAGGGELNLGGNGGGRIWINVTDTFHIDGLVSCHGADGSVHGNGYSGNKNKLSAPQCYHRNWYIIK